MPAAYRYIAVRVPVDVLSTMLDDLRKFRKTHKPRNVAITINASVDTAEMWGVDFEDDGGDVFAASGEVPSLDYENDGEPLIDRSTPRVGAYAGVQLSATALEQAVQTALDDLHYSEEYVDVILSNNDAHKGRWHLSFENDGILSMASNRKPVKYSAHAEDIYYTNLLAEV